MCRRQDLWERKKRRSTRVTAARVSTRTPVLLGPQVPIAGRLSTCFDGSRSPAVEPARVWMALQPVAETSAIVHRVLREAHFFGERGRKRKRMPHGHIDQFPKPMKPHQGKRYYERSDHTRRARTCPPGFQRGCRR